MAEPAATEPEPEDAPRGALRGALASLGLGEGDARAVERGVFNYAVQLAASRRVPRNWRNRAFRLLYDGKARSLLANLDASSYVGNSALLGRVLAGEVEPGALAGAHAVELYPERWRDVQERSSERDKYIAAGGGATAGCITDQFKCGRCKKNHCSYFEFQTRACDEPATIFISCQACGNHWRIG